MIDWPQTLTIAETSARRFLMMTAEKAETTALTRTSRPPSARDRPWRLPMRASAGDWITATPPTPASMATAVRAVSGSPGRRKCPSTATQIAKVEKRSAVSPESIHCSAVKTQAYETPIWRNPIKAIARRCAAVTEGLLRVSRKIVSRTNARASRRPANRNGGRPARPILMKSQLPLQRMESSQKAARSRARGGCIARMLVQRPAAAVNTMHPVQTAKPGAPGDLYKDLAASLAALLEGEPDALANLSNASALLAEALPRINWCGFYLLRGGELVLGPFQGKPACVRIPMGKGVCGTAAARRETLVVPDVEKFPGHIACDAASRSEIVVPLMDGGTLRGVLDVDAPVAGRFDERDREGLERFVRTLMPLVNWQNV